MSEKTKINVLVCGDSSAVDGLTRMLNAPGNEYIEFFDLSNVAGRNAEGVLYIPRNGELKNPAVQMPLAGHGKAMVGIYDEGMVPEYLNPNIAVVDLSDINRNKDAVYNQILQFYTS